MKNVLNVYRYMTEILIANNENCSKLFIESYTYSQKILIFVYDDCARICEINQYSDSLRIESYFTIDFPNRDEARKETLNKINFEEFMEKYPKDESSNKNWIKEMTFVELDEYLQKFKN